MSKSYYKGGGNFRKSYGLLLLLIPPQGSCKDLEIELFRLTVRLYHGYHDKINSLDSRVEEFRHVAEMFNDILLLELVEDDLNDIIVGKLTDENMERLMDKVVVIAADIRERFSGDPAKDWENIAEELYNLLNTDEATERVKQSLERFNKCKQFHKS